ncbi:MAG: DUF2089 domain-containing protein [Spirochaetia bacterium]|jgi:hypothetical protein
MEKRTLRECPVCGNTLRIKVLQCPSCAVRIEGNFDPPHSRIFNLSHKDLDFVELFVKLRGNIKEVEKALKVSYPTVRGMLDSVIRKMGYTVKRENDEKRRFEIIEQLEKGEISADKAAILLQEDEADQDDISS